MRKLKLMDGHAVPNVPLSGENIPGLTDSGPDDASGGSDVENAGAFAERARFKQKLSNLGVDKLGRPAPAGVTASDLHDDAEAARKKKKPFSKKNVARPPDTPNARGGDDDEDYSQSGRRRSRDRVRESEETLPFELVGLEVALEIVCNQLERDRRDVGEEVRASLAGLRKKVDTFNLERVRRVKSKVTRLTGRVAKVREEIKRYLDDDSDMRDMYLTRKALVEGLHANENMNMAGSGDFGAFRGRQSVNFHSGSFHAVHGSGGSFKMRRQSLNFGGGSGDSGDGGSNDPNASDQAGSLKGGGGSGLPATPNVPHAEDAAGVFGEELFPHQEDSDLQVVEDLLETYFAHIDSTYAELDAIDQFINDTEDFVNIQLDVTRNQLQKFEVTLTSATLFVSMYSMIGGIYGMNLRNGAESSHATFVLVNALCATGAVVGFAVVMLYIRSKKWM
jgi:magnesium transporter